MMRASYKARDKVGGFFERGMQNFDRDIAIERGVVRFEDGCHTALPERLDDAIGTYIVAG